MPTSPSSVRTRVTRDEDGILRRLHCLEQLGARLSPQMRILKGEILARDLRREVREPEDSGVVTPLWIT